MWQTKEFLIGLCRYAKASAPHPPFYIEKANQAGIAGTTPDGMLAAVLLRRGAEMSSSSHSKSQLFQPTPVR